jgi:hypothetical protein
LIACRNFLFLPVPEGEAGVGVINNNILLSLPQPLPNGRGVFVQTPFLFWNYLAIFMA